MKDSQVPLHGDGDGHEDTAGEEDIVEGVEEVRKQMMVKLGDHVLKFRAICYPIFKRLVNAFKNTENKEEEIEYCNGNEKAV